MKIINARIQSILKRFPDVERIFEWYEIELTDETKLLRLEDACERFQIEAEDIVLDLEEAIQDSRDVDWLGSNDDETQWTRSENGLAFSAANLERGPACDIPR